MTVTESRPRDLQVHEPDRSTIFAADPDVGHAAVVGDDYGSRRAGFDPKLGNAFWDSDYLLEEARLSAATAQVVVAPGLRVGRGLE